MNHALDLTKTQWQRSFGDVTALGSWFGKDATPCIVLVASRSLGTERAIPCVVMLNNAWMWDEEIGIPSYAVKNSITFADALGLNAADPRSVIRVTSIIHECLQDLLTMPPRPKGDQVVVADAIITDQSTGKERHSEVLGNG